MALDNVGIEVKTGLKVNDDDEGRWEIDFEATIEQRDSGGGLGQWLRAIGDDDGLMDETGDY